MKTVFNIFFIALIAGFFSCCEEIGPQINGGGNNNTDTTQNKNVLVEEFTAVRCNNCPTAHQLIEDIVDQYPAGAVEIVEIHNGILSTPYSFGNHDFNIPEADAIDGLLGGFPFQPSAATDRKLFTGESAIILGTSSWAGYIGSQSDDTLKAKIFLDKNYNSTTRELQVDVEINYLVDVAEDNNVSAMITESNIIEPQLLPNLDIDTFYVHDHVLRGMMTPFNGDPISGNKTAGSVFTKSYSMTLPVEWNVDECRVVVFVSNVNGSFDVLQVIGEDVN